MWAANNGFNLAYNVSKKYEKVKRIQSVLKEELAKRSLK